MPATAASNWFNYICLNSPRTSNQLKRSIGCKETCFSWGTTNCPWGRGLNKSPCCDRNAFPTIARHRRKDGVCLIPFHFKTKNWLARAVKALLIFFLKQKQKQQQKHWTIAEVLRIPWSSIILWEHFPSHWAQHSYRAYSWDLDFAPNLVCTKRGQAAGIFWSGVCPH